MDNYTCLIVDDEIKAIELLEYNLGIFYKNIQVVGTYSRWDDAIDAIRASDVDILFLDISMQDKNGMDLVRYAPNLQSEVIFVTAHADYAVEAFRLSAAGYIVKPIDKTEFVATLDNVLEKIRNKRLAKKALSSEVHIQKRIGIPSGKAIDYVNIQDIICLEAVNSYTKIITDETEILSSYNIGKFKELLDDAMFYQVHRSYIINLNHIRRYEASGFVIMSNSKEIPLSKSQREHFLSLFSKLARNTKP
ncbi:MAG: response regulator transcription factor [Flavipsychrobacter sp.]|jgi:two-component system LytT family response regulator|nr:response regulator transcription factor [Flavipsychrobacter sp.]